ncbi:hypothetical protein QQS21_011670 [Conoideocrella luteorostrata]|uniref:Uncharacterized protein n=1 Tax=Conoideocrella luteorostrata TaxID=1105319 RepID=A0AAJ0CEZ9_9HYPO|nr:hypothetical protein QQS21_011670 [Conoideocrella luteorostrata]
MALTIKQLNGDASFLLTFEPIELDSPGVAQSSEPFRILLDPCLVKPFNTRDSKWCSSTSARATYVSLKDLPEPDLVIISNSRRDQCNEATLRQFSPYGAKPFILAEPTASKMIQSWRYFEDGKVSTLHRWQDPRQTGRNTVVRIPIPARVIGGDEGMVTVAFVTQKRDIKGLRSAVGITYRPASSARSISPRPASTIITTAMTTSPSTMSKRESFGLVATLDSPTLPPLPAFTPLTPPATPVLQSIRTTRSMASLSPHARDRGVSVIFSPHGIPYRDIEPYATSHLLAEAALPLTALMHCFDTVSRPWWLGGILTSGFEDGQEIIAKLGARAWISAYDGQKSFNGLARKFTHRRKYTRDEVQQLIRETTDTLALDPRPSSGRSKRVERPTEVLALAVDEDVTLTSEGIWATQPPSSIDLKRLSIRHIHTDDSMPSASMATYRMSQLQPVAGVA